MYTVDAAYNTVHDYPGGSESLGPRVANGQFMQTIHSALADGVVDQKELEAIKAVKNVVETAAATVAKPISDSWI